VPLGLHRRLRYHGEQFLTGVGELVEGAVVFQIGETDFPLGLGEDFPCECGGGEEQG